VTVPVAEEDATVAVSVKLVPVVTVVAEEVSVVVVEVVPVGACQKSPQPDRNGTNASIIINISSAVFLRTGMYSILCPFRRVGEEE
jgi:hypothetical protein